MKKNNLITVSTILLALGVITPVCNAHPAYKVQDALEALEAGDLEKAESFLQNARFEEPDSYEINYNLGIVSYRKRDYAKSVKFFARASELVRTPDERFNSFYNMGNAAFKGYDYALAITAYKNALAVKNDYQADYNLKIAEKKLQEQLERMKKDQEQQQQPNQDNKQQNQQQNGQKEQQQNGQQNNANSANSSESAQSDENQDNNANDANQANSANSSDRSQSNENQHNSANKSNDSSSANDTNQANSANSPESAQSDENQDNNADNADNANNANNSNDANQANSPESAQSDENKENNADNADNANNSNDANQANASDSAQINEDSQTSAAPESDRREVKMSEDKGRVGRPEASQKARAMKNVKLNKKDVEAYLKEMEAREAEAQKYYRINNISEKDPAYMDQDELREWMRVRNRKKEQSRSNLQDW